ncbi:MAG: hypothetical protein V7776_10060 [Halopseudomonas aestusnigri]
MKRSQLDLHRFEKVLGLLDSASEGEALAALGRAKHLLAGAGISFNELKVGISSFQGDDQGVDMETAHVQKLENELESLRWSLARHELQIATLRQSVEEKSSQIQIEQTKRYAHEGELTGLRKAHAVQMEEALNRKEEADKLAKQLEVYKAVEKITGIGPNTSILHKTSKIVKATTGIKSRKQNSKAKICGAATNMESEVHDASGPPSKYLASTEVSSMDISSKKSSSKGMSSKLVASKKNPSLVGSAASKKNNATVRQGALNLVGGEDKSFGKEFRWARIEEKHQMIVEGADIRADIGNDTHGSVASHGQTSHGQASQGQTIGIQAEA